MRLISGTSSIGVLSATITWPHRGPWVADLVLDETRSPSGTVTIEQGSVRLRGTVSTSSQFAGRAGVRIVAGAGWAEAVQPRQYRGAPLRLVLDDLARDAGESVAATETAVGATILQTWARAEAGPVRALDELVLALGEDYAWRVSDGGTAILGPESWSAASPRRARVLEEDVSAGMLSVDDELLELRPGTTWEGRRVSAVQAQWSSDRARSRVWVSRGAARGLGEALARAVEERLPAAVWGRLHPCRVHSQDADGSLQVIPDDSTVPALVGVPLRTGIPGVEVEVLAGARVLLAFEAEDPRRPIALPAFDGDTTKLRAIRLTADSEIQVNAPVVKVVDNGGELRIGDAPANQFARVGDIVQVAAVLIVPDPTKGIQLIAPTGPVVGTIGTPAVPCVLVGQILSGCPQAIG